MADNSSLRAAMSPAIDRVRPIALVVLVVGIALGIIEGMWAVAVGLGVSGGLLLGPFVSYLKSRMKTRAGRTTTTPTAGTMTTMAVLVSLPPLVIGGICVIAASRYWWIGFPGGFFLGIGLADMAIYSALIRAVRTKDVSTTS